MNIVEGGTQEIEVEVGDAFRMTFPEAEDGTPGVEVKAYGAGPGVIRLDGSGIAEDAPFLVRGDLVVITLGDGTGVYMTKAQAQLVATALEFG